MPPESAKFLRDILDCVNRVVEYTSGKTKADYLADAKLRDAVQWNFAVIGEAMSQLARQDAAMMESISEHRRIIAFRNQLIHGYGVVNHDITWDIVVTKLPILRREVESLLS